MYFSRIFALASGGSIRTIPQACSLPGRGGERGGEGKKDPRSSTTLTISARGACWMKTRLEKGRRTRGCSTGACGKRPGGGLDYGNLLATTFLPTEEKKKGGGKGGGEEKTDRG